MQCSNVMACVYLLFADVEVHESLFQVAFLDRIAKERLLFSRKWS